MRTYDLRSHFDIDVDTVRSDIVHQHIPGNMRERRAGVINCELNLFSTRLTAMMRARWLPKRLARFYEPPTDSSVLGEFSASHGVECGIPNQASLVATSELYSVYQ